MATTTGRLPMGVGSGSQGRARSVRLLFKHTVMPALTALFFLAAAGCGTKNEDKSADAQNAGDSRPTATANDTKPTTKSSERRPSKDTQTVPASHQSMPAGRTNRVRLTGTSCVQFEPHWAEIPTGQSLTWHSDLKSSVTIHVTTGAFDKSEYVVRPGATVSTGPAQSPGSFSIWTEPTACQKIPRGVQSSGPGVTVEGAAQRH
jgi:hypothetical protein